MNYWFSVLNKNVKSLNLALRWIQIQAIYSFFISFCIFWNENKNIWVITTKFASNYKVFFHIKQYKALNNSLVFLWKSLKTRSFVCKGNYNWNIQKTRFISKRLNFKKFKSLNNNLSAAPVQKLLTCLNVSTCTNQV